MNGGLATWLSVTSDDLVTVETVELLYKILGSVKTFLFLQWIGTAYFYPCNLVAHQPFMDLATILLFYFCSVIGNNDPFS